MAEHLAGSEEAFVARMNKKAAELGMVNTNFVNSTGLPVENHYTTARDIAIMTRELLKHPIILDYTCIWMDTLRNGEMGLSNTNKLVRFYPGANGMKTGYTDSAKYCLSATAKRDKLQLIAVVMKASSSDERFSDAKKLLDFGFANFSVYSADVSHLPKLSVTGGVKENVDLSCKTSDILVAKGREGQIVPYVELPEKIKAPVNEGDVVGRILYKIGDEVVTEVEIVSAQSVKRAGFTDILRNIFHKTASL
jgi:D-alanyl-D-alanine carboxypeptidase (penicillin-binding protein 5/6)